MKKTLIIAGLTFAPVLAFAQTLQNVNGLLQGFGTLVNTALPIVVGIAILGFFWGLAMFIFKASDSGAREEARHMMIWSVVALFVMVSIWGLVNFLGTAVGVGQGTQAPGVQIPTVQTH